jgi:hypothetical protein
VARTGRLITSGAVILFLAFVSLSRVPAIDVRIVAAAPALGVLIDATVQSSHRKRQFPGQVMTEGGLSARPSGFDHAAETAVAPPRRPSCSGSGAAA